MALNVAMSQYLNEAEGAGLGTDSLTSSARFRLSYVAFGVAAQSIPL
jgi:hypothetical protein